MEEIIPERFQILNNEFIQIGVVFCWVFVLILWKCISIWFSLACLFSQLDSRTQFEHLFSGVSF